MEKQKRMIAFENGIEGTPDVLYRVRGYSSAEDMWVTDWFADGDKAIKHRNFLAKNDYDHVTMTEYTVI